MEIAIYFSDITKFNKIKKIIEKNYEDILIKTRDIESKILVSSLKLINKNNIKRIYFGEEFCEYLIPSIDDIKKVVKYINRKNLEFTFVTGIIPEGYLNKIETILEFLNENGYFEVVINDFGVLNIIRKYENIKPIIGRLLNKLKRMPRYSKNLPEPVIERIETSKETILNNQLELLKNSNLTISLYSEFLSNLKIKRIEFDILPQGININNDNFNYSFYFPWTYITSRPNCLPYEELQNKFHSYKRYCDKNCKEYCVLIKSNIETFDIVMKGKVIFMNSINKFNEYYKKFDRIVFEPFLPV